LVLAPMAGVTNRAFRLLCREQGAGLVFTEMVSATALLYGNRKTRQLLVFGPDEGPVGVQLFGADPETMAEAARLVAELGFVCIDVNMGCPAPKIAQAGRAGVALMKDPELAYDVVRAMVRAVGEQVPVTVKLRAGWDEQSINAPEVARAVTAAGAVMVSVHGRTRAQMYRGEADRGIIRAVKEAVAVPVCGSGDVFTPQAAAMMFAETGCDGVMFARGALGNPWIFARTLTYLKTCVLPPAPGYEERLGMLLRHLELLLELKGEYIAVREMRRHAAWYTKGLPGAAQFRDQIQRAASREEFYAMVRNYARDLAAEGKPGGQYSG